nr:ribonuclease H-like domain-containing protein [Tanacetum cinerariifolium]
MVCVDLANQVFTYGLQLFSSTTDFLIAYLDVDWAGCPTTRRSTSGYCIFLRNNLLSWSSKRQPTLSHSSVEAEYRGVANSVAETCWIWNLLCELHTPLSSDTIVYCDNVSVVSLSSNPVQHQRTKHIEIAIHFVRDLISTGQVRVLHVPSRFQYAYIFTKGLPSTLFDEFLDSLSSFHCSCHDIYKYGKRYEHLNSAIPIKFDKEKVAKTVVPVEKKKTTTVKPSLVTVNRDVSARSNAGVKKKEIKTVKKAEATCKTCPAKKFIPKATLTDSRSQKASLSRAESLKATKSKSAKKVAPLKDQNRMHKSKPEQTSSDKVQTQALQDGEAESEIEALDGFETEPEVRLKTMEFDFILPSMELVDPPVCNEFEPFSCSDIGEEESLITYTVNERFKPIPDEEIPENSTIIPTVIESSHASSNKEVLEESLTAPPVSESTQDEGVLEDEYECTDDYNEEVEDKVRRKGRGVISEDKDDKGVKLKFRRGKVLDIHQSENNDSKNGHKSVFLKHQGEQEKKDAHGLWNNIIEETASKLAKSTKSKVKALVGAFETVIYLSKTANPLPRNVTNIQVLATVGSTNENM